jgi:hypothetical protein
MARRKVQSKPEGATDPPSGGRKLPSKKAASKKAVASTTASTTTASKEPVCKETKANEATPTGVSGAAGAGAAGPRVTTRTRGIIAETKPRKAGPRRPIRCYLCGKSFEVSTKTMSTTCPGCNKAIKVEDVKVKSYLPVNDLQTCGWIRITRKGRVAARHLQSGDGVVCEGTIEGSIETDGEVTLGPKASWKGDKLHSRSLEVADGASLTGHVQVPWKRDDE